MKEPTKVKANRKNQQESPKTQNMEQQKIKRINRKDPNTQNSGSKKIERTYTEGTNGYTMNEQNNLNNYQKIKSITITIQQLTQ